MKPENYRFHSTGQFRNVVKNIKTSSQFKGIDEQGEPIVDKNAPAPVVDYIGTVKTHTQPLQDTFSDETIHCIMDECKALSITVWIGKDEVILFWLDVSYFVKNVSDYNKVVGAIKLLKSFS